eukprot:SAG31_NODE_3316_length_4425_cov_3.196024_7_plen_85_part_00
MVHVDADTQPLHFEYTSWDPPTNEPTHFHKVNNESALRIFGNDQVALDSAHAQAKNAGQFLLAYLLEHDDRPVSQYLGMILNSV